MARHFSFNFFTGLLRCPLSEAGSARYYTSTPPPSAFVAGFLSSRNATWCDIARRYLPKMASKSRKRSPLCYLIHSCIEAECCVAFVTLP
ncbi:hypothetical protein CDAR_213001 [Caerostris darwini]|uniref:Secreted protein n=1 Tax=Caerostris darwini TaxID=1538125 RepID=A0AAV4UBN3_9ARAC|nr:hypothetical protein CDAR_213001 [Caerostris darwini]